MDDFKDERFKGIIKDPRFKKIPPKLTSQKFDKRIHGMFSDKRFNLGCRVDKHGMPLDCKSGKSHPRFRQINQSEQGVKAKHNLSDDVHKKDMDEESDDEEEEEEEDVKSRSLRSVKTKCDLPDNDEHKKDTDEESDTSSEDVMSGSFIKQFPQIDGSDEEDGSTSTDTEISDNEQEDEIDHHWQELDADAPRSGNITHRLAVCNMDWDRLRAEDLLVVFNSFTPQNSVIHSVKIYPSEFGIERMEKEKLHGPVELIKMDSTQDQATNGTQDSEFSREKLRQYQINRLKYFFAVVDCDTPETADALYVELNGMEFENSGCILDLRFIPDDMTFAQEPVSAETSVSKPEDYKPTSFVTSALNQIKVDLTWDETDPRRKEVLEKAFTDPESIENDLKQYLASPSESEGETDLGESSNSKRLSSTDAVSKLRALLDAYEGKEKGKEDEEFDMEITWDSGLKEKAEELVKEKTLKETLTPFEEKLQKRKELKKMKKETKATPEKENDGMNSNEEHDSEDITDDELQEKVKGASRGSKKNKVKSETSEADEKKLAELALLVEEPDTKDSSDSDDMSNKRKKRMKKKKKRDNEKKEDSSEGYVHDPRFAAMYTSHLYHVDPAEQKFKQKKEIRVFINETQRKKYGVSDSPVTPYEISKTEMTNVIEGSQGKGKKSNKVEALKEKLTPFCRDFQKKKELRKLHRQEDQSLQKEEDFTVTSENLPVSLSDASISKKNRKKQKAEKRKFHEIKQKDEMSTSSKNISASSDLEANDDSDILIFSMGSAKKQISTHAADSPHSTNSVRKKLKKHVS